MSANRGETSARELYISVLMSHREAAETCRDLHGETDAVRAVIRWFDREIEELRECAWVPDRYPALHLVPDNQQRMFDEERMPTQTSLFEVAS